MRKLIVVAALLFCPLLFGVHPALAKAKSKGASASSGRARIPERTGSPYHGAIVVNAETGEVVFEDNADAECYPASIIKLMDTLIIQEQIEAGVLRLTDRVPVSADVARIGGSQVYLKENESFPVEDMLYALMIQSANDAAVALAIRVAGSTDAFVTTMQQKADALGMKGTKFHTVHGLPPAKGQEPDVSTARDLVILARELLKHPDILRYTSAPVRTFRNDTMVMQSHNKLLTSLEGCDGLKTGYFKLGGYSIVATAQRGGNRFIAAVVGAKEKKVRDAKAKELITQAFGKVPPTPKVSRTPATPALGAQREAPKPAHAPSTRYAKRILLTLAVMLLIGGSFWMGRRSGGGPPPTPGVRLELKK